MAIEWKIWTLNQSLSKSTANDFHPILKEQNITTIGTHEKQTSFD